MSGQWLTKRRVDSGLMSRGQRSKHTNSYPPYSTSHRSAYNDVQQLLTLRFSVRQIRIGVREEQDHFLCWMIRKAIPLLIVRSMGY